MMSPSLGSLRTADPKIMCLPESQGTSDDSYYRERALCWRSHPPQRQNCCLLRDFQSEVELPKMMSRSSSRSPPFCFFHPIDLAKPMPNLVESEKSLKAESVREVVDCGAFG